MDNFRYPSAAETLGINWEELIINQIAPQHPTQFKQLISPLPGGQNLKEVCGFTQENLVKALQEKNYPVFKDVLTEYENNKNVISEKTL